MTIAEKILLLLSRKPGEADLTAGRNEWKSEDPLSLLVRVFPDLLESIIGKSVLDYGCGEGHQAVALAQRGAKRVLGIDPSLKALAEAKILTQKANLQNKVDFLDRFGPACVNKFDVVISQNCMEHFPDPALALDEMKAALKTSGRIFLTFGPPWFSPHGSHMQFFVKVPWVNILFSEKTVMNVRSNFRQDGAVRYEDVESGLNRMTVSKFERILSEGGLKCLYRKYECVKGLNVSRTLPVLRELFINHISCVLTRT